MILTLHVGGRATYVQRTTPFLYTAAHQHIQKQKGETLYTE